MPPAETALVELIDRYLGGERSRRLVDEIEGIVIQSFEDEDWYDEVGTVLALYAPAERGGPYVGDEELEQVLRWVRARVKGHS